MCFNTMTLNKSAICEYIIQSLSDSIIVKQRILSDETLLFAIKKYLMYVSTHYTGPAYYWLEMEVAQQMLNILQLNLLADLCVIGPVCQLLH